MQKYFEINRLGHNVRCKLYYRDLHTAARAVVFGTGFAGHKDNKAAERFAETALSKYKDVAVAVFNWPGHGDDVKKKLLLEDHDTYLTLVTEELRERFGMRELYAYATSYGGYLVLKYISEHGNPFRKIALRCPAVDMYDVLTRAIMKEDEFDRIAKGRDALVGFDRKISVSRAFLDQIKANDIRGRDFLEFAEDILILHGTKDEVVPFESCRAFAEDNLIEFVPVEGADHRFMDPEHMNRANKAVLQFFGL